MAAPETAAHDLEPPPPSAADVAASLRLATSPVARIGYVLLLFFCLGAAGGIGTLLLTEPGRLPPDTQLAFAAMVLVALSWSALAASCCAGGGRCLRSIGSSRAALPLPPRRCSWSAPPPPPLPSTAATALWR